MKISIVYLTYRPGGFDMLADSLRNQTIQDYELIIIDDYQIDRREMVKQYLEKKGVKLKHIGRSKPKCFPDTLCNFINALNTGILASTGDMIMLIQDYTWLSPHCLERWLKHEDFFDEKGCIAGIGKYWAKEPNVQKNLMDPISIWKDDWQGSPEQNGWTEYTMWIGDPFELFYAALPYEVLTETNGFQEWGDYIPGCFLLVESFTRHLKKIGGKIYTDKENICELINHKLWKPRRLWHSLAQNPYGRRIVSYSKMSQEVQRAMGYVSERMGKDEVPSWWEAKYEGGGTNIKPIVFSMRTQGNCFDLKKHVRGEIFWE